MEHDIGYLSKEKSVNLLYTNQEDTSSQGIVKLKYYDVLNSVFDFRSGVDIYTLSYALGLYFFHTVEDKTLISQLRFAREGLFLDINVVMDMMKYLELDRKVNYYNGVYVITEEGKTDLLEYRKTYL